MPFGFWPGARGASPDCPQAYCCIAPANKNRDKEPSTSRFHLLVTIITSPPHLMFSSGRLWHRACVEDHPGRAEPVSEHPKAEGEKRLLHRHEDFAPLREQGINALRLV